MCLLQLHLVLITYCSINNNCPFKVLENVSDMHNFPSYNKGFFTTFTNITWNIIIERPGKFWAGEQTLWLEGVSIAFLLIKLHILHILLLHVCKPFLEKIAANNL